MSSEPTTRRGHSLALRLTLWYSGILAGSCGLAFAFVYGLIVATVQDRLDEDLSDDVAEFAALYESGGQARVEHEMRLDTKGEEAEKSFFRLWTRDGRLVVATDLGLHRHPVPLELDGAGSRDRAPSLHYS
jgi:hypothetical protein